MSEEIKFDLDGDIIMQIEMDSYIKYNNTIASMNDHLGEIYGYSDVRDTEEAQLKYEKELAYKAIVQLQKKVEQSEKANDKLKHKLNDIAFGDDSELALRFLRKIDYVDFDEKRKVYINKHNNEPFLWKDEQEKDYYLKDEELNEYTQQLEYKVEQIENIRKEAIEELSYMSTDAYVEDYDIREKHYNLLMNILNKGDNNVKD